MGDSPATILKYHAQLPKMVIRRFVERKPALTVRRYESESIKEGKTVVLGLRSNACKFSANVMVNFAGKLIGSCIGQERVGHFPLSANACKFSSILITEVR